MDNSSHQFSKSQQLAISYLTKSIESFSNWKNFTWFHKIAASEITETGEDFAGGSKFKKIERTIFFYGYLNILIARVYLEGNQFTNSNGSKPTFWRVVSVHYVNNYDESSPYQKRNWIQLKIEEKDQVLV